MASKFNPAQHPRDRFGRFTKSRTVKASAKDKRAARELADGFTPKQIGAGDRQAYLRKIAGRDAAGQAFAGLVETNKALRAGKDSPAAADLEQSMVALPDDVLLSRRVPLSAFGATDPQSLAGMKVRDAGFAPAQYGTDPAAAGQVRMHLAVPAGTRAAVNPDSGEVVLDRDTEMVVARVDTNSAGGHDMYLTVLPKAAAEPDADSDADPDAADAPDGTGKVRADLMKLRVPQLRAQMRERGLKPGRLRKSQLVDALIRDETGDDSGPKPAAEASAERSKPQPAPSPTIQAPPGGAATGDAALAAAPAGLHRDDNGLTGAESDGLAEYQDGTRPGFRGINRALRDGTADSAAQAAIDGIDAAMARSGLTSDVTVHRGIRNARSMFGDRLDGDLTGMRWREDAYLSTTGDKQAAAEFSRGTDGVRMSIVAPKGTGAVDLSDPDDPSEQELLLDRGHDLEVVADRGVIDGIRQLDVRVLPKSTTSTGQGAPAGTNPAPGPPTLADRVNAGIADRRTLSGGQNAKTELLTLADGTQVVSKKAKPIEGRPAREQQDAEELTPLVLSAAGLRAPEIYRPTANQLYMEYLDGTVAAEHRVPGTFRVDPGAYDPDQGLLLGLVDQITDNYDRNGGNWLIGDGGQVLPIDHGFAFSFYGSSTPGTPMQAVDQPAAVFHGAFPNFGQWADNDLSPQDITVLRERLVALRPEFDRVGRGDWHDNMLARLDALAPHARGSKRRIP